MFSTVVNKAAMNIGVYICFLINVFWGIVLNKYPGVEFLDDMTVLFLTF